MKRFVLFALLTLLPIQCFALDSDKQKHILASILTFSAAYVVTEDVNTSILFGMGVGLAKEIYDSTSRTDDAFDTHDLAADAVGIGLGFMWVKNF
ncbi:MAG: hypothetical protein PHH36_07050 [Sideroxydans sp.]|nr:hypothetical protein [Sideroxydans sp.]